MARPVVEVAGRAHGGHALDPGVAGGGAHRQRAAGAEPGEPDPERAGGSRRRGRPRRRCRRASRRARTALRVAAAPEGEGEGGPAHLGGDAVGQLGHRVGGRGRRCPSTGSRGTGRPPGAARPGGPGAGPGGRRGCSPSRADALVHRHAAAGRGRQAASLRLVDAGGLAAARGRSGPGGSPRLRASASVSGPKQMNVSASISSVDGRLDRSSVRGRCRGRPACACRPRSWLCSNRIGRSMRADGTPAAAQRPNLPSVRPDHPGAPAGR